MKTIVIAGAVAVLSAASAPAFAQTANNSDLNNAVTGYANLGYSLVDAGPNLSAINGRVGARFMRFLGAEGEATFGINTRTDGLTGVRDKLRSQYAAYAVGALPLGPRADLFARIGYGHSNFRTTDTAGVSTTFGRDSVNYGAGGEVFFTANDGIRADYTREEFTHGPEHANVWSLSYVRKFP